MQLFYSRQMLDSAVRAHRKHMTSLQAAVSKTEFRETDKDQTPASPHTALEQGKCMCVRCFFYFNDINMSMVRS